MDNEEIIINVKNQQGEFVPCKVMGTFRIPERGKDYIALMQISEDGELLISEDGDIQIELFRYELFTDEETQESSISLIDIPSDMEYEEATSIFTRMIDDSYEE